MRNLSIFAFLFSLWLGTNAHAEICEACVEGDTTVGTCSCAESEIVTLTTCEECSNGNGCCWNSQES